MRIVLRVEGGTERACRGVLKALLDAASGERGKDPVGLDLRSYRGSRMWDVDTVARDVIDALGARDVLGVVTLVDVYPRFGSAEEAKRAYSRCVDSPRFRAHCALHEFEAWLLPLWPRVYQLARRPAPKRCPWPSPERVDLVQPPSHVLGDLFASARGYQKTFHAPRILRTPEDLRTSAAACPELKAFLNTLLDFAGLETSI